MNIVHLSPTYFSPQSVTGGGERYVNNIAHSIWAAARHRALGLKQEIVTIGSKQTEIDQEWGKIRILENTSDKSGLMAGRSREIHGVISKANIVHIHQSLTDFGAYCLAAAKSLNLPTVTTDLGGGENEVMLNGGGLELSNAVVSISDFAKRSIAPYYKGEHRVIIGPVNTDFFLPAKDCPAKSGNRVLSVGRIMPHKGIDQVIRALPSGMKLLVVGTVYDRKYYRKLKLLALGKDIEFIHNIDDEALRKLYQSSDVLVQASTHVDYLGNFHNKPELMGLTTLEALSCGLPVIVSQAGSLPELATDQNYGLVFKSVEELHRQLTAVKNGTWPINACRKTVHELILKRHGTLCTGDAFINLYTDIIKSV